MKITDEELKTLQDASDESTWNRACDQIKAARNGEYPPDWGPRVIGSGLLNRKIAEFSGAVPPTA